jgi:hypothetical protein
MTEWASTDTRPVGVIGRPLGRRFRVDSTTTNGELPQICRAPPHT